MRCCYSFGLTVLIASFGSAQPPAMKAGVATAILTPAEPMWLAGYAARNKPSEGKVHDLFAKALCLEDASGTAVILLTTDLIGLPRPVSESTADLVTKATGLPRERLMLTASHTHTGPVLRDNLADMYDLPAAEAAKIRAYTAGLPKLLADVMIDAYRKRAPAKLATGEGEAGFAINRRQATDKGVVIGLNPTGPVDHRVPVLSVTSPEGKLLAAVFGYACHNTTLDFYRWCGDYAGFAQAEFEKAHPGAVGLFWIGCGADANPTPRRELAHAERHGRELANAVDAVLRKPMTPLNGSLRANYRTIPLDFDALPTREKLQADSISKNFALKTRAARLLKEWDANGSIAKTYPHYPVQTWTVGDELTWVALGGEVVVDYSIRLRKELAPKGAFWATGYANDVMAYIPSERVLQEGGYEADSSMIYYGMPTRWAKGLEQKIVDEVKKQVK